MATPTKQIKKAAEALLGATPSPKKGIKFVEPKAPPKPPVEEDEVIDQFSLDMAKVKAEPRLREDDLLEMEDYTAFADTVDEAQSVFKQAESVYGGMQLMPLSVVDTKPVSAALGPAWPMLTHYSDEAKEAMSAIALNQGRGNQYLTSITDEDAALVSQAYLKKNDMNVGNVMALRDDMNDYEHFRGFPYVPQLEATVDSAGDVRITGIDRTKGDDGRGWNSLMLLSGTTMDANALKHMPLVINFDKPLFEHADKLSGRVFVGDRQLTGIKFNATKPKSGVKIEDGSFIDEPIADSNDAATRVAMLFDPKTADRAILARHTQGAMSDHKKLKALAWPSANGQPSTLAQKTTKQSTESYFPEDDAGESFFDKWLPPQSAARTAVQEYTAGSPYKARLVNPNAPKDAPMLLFRGAQGNQFVDSSGKLQTLKVMDPRNAREFGAHVGSMDQAQYFALRGFIPQSHIPDVIHNGRKALRENQHFGQQLLDNQILHKESLKVLWEGFVDEVKIHTGWGKKKKAIGFDDEAQVVIRPDANTLLNAMHDVLAQPAYRELRDAFSGMGGTYTGKINSAMSVIAKGNSDLDAFVTNAKAPLMLWDTGGFSAQSIIRQLQDKPQFQKYSGELSDLLKYADDMVWSDQGFSNQANFRLREILEAEGYDHIAYVNMMESVGTPSFIFWKKDSLRPLTDFGVEDETLKLLSAPTLAILAARAAMDGEQPKEGAGVDDGA